MKVISFDIGIKNMAYCIFTTDVLDGTPFKVLDWNVLNLLDKEEPQVFCNCLAVKQVPPKKKPAKNPIKNIFLRHCVLEPSERNQTELSSVLPPPPKLCGRIAKYKKGDRNFCDKHSKTQTENRIPETRFSIKSLKKAKIDDLIKFANQEFHLYDLPKKRADIIDVLLQKISEVCLEPIIEKKSKTANEVDLITIGRNMKKLMNEVLEKGHTDITHIIMENQISPIANRMKTIQGMLAQYFIMVLENNIQMEFISSANKLKGFQVSKNSNKDDSVGQQEETQRQKYMEHKKDGVFYSKKVLEKNEWIVGERWGNIFESKKKDDLADCFLQGLWYLKNRQMVEMNPEFEIIKK